MYDIPSQLYVALSSVNSLHFLLLPGCSLAIMKSSAQSILSILAFIVLIQPCTAPFIIPLAEAAAEAAGLAAGAVKPKDRRAPRATTPWKSTRAGAYQSGVWDMTSCAMDVFGSASLRVEMGSDSSIMIDGWPQSCMANFQAYNQYGSSGSSYGTTTVVNETCVSVSGLGQEVMAVTLSGLEPLLA
jgi:hypothetical protein